MSKNITVTLKDGPSLEVSKGIPVGTAILGLNPKLEEKLIAAEVNGKIVDLSYPLEKDASFSPIFIDSKQGKEILRHSTAHVMADAVKRLFPEVKLAIGPAIEEGFYYDFDLETSFSPDDLKRLEEEMKGIIRADLPFRREVLPREEALRFMKERKEDFKVEMIEDLEDEGISFYWHGDFVDMCRGPHIPSTGFIKAFRLLSIAGSYWKGDERNKMLQRIYGTAFPNEEELKAHLGRMEQAKKRDHRILGRSLDLYSIHENLGPGLVLWHPKGGFIRNVIETFWREEHLRRGYDILYTPHLGKVNLWETSGHLEYYQESMFPSVEVEGQGYLVRPMNCPGHILIYKTRKRSYRDLPLRWAELGTVYRYERSGTLAGLLRVRGFTQDDAHIFCREDQIKEEVEGVLDLADFMLKSFQYDYKVVLSTRPEKFIGVPELWDRVEKALSSALEKKEIPYEVDKGGGVFYAPKIDIMLIDALGRGWQGPTIQVDFNLPERFDLTYMGKDGKEHRTVMIHRTVLGSMERFMAGLVEHFAGNFPLWLSPVQVRILTITDAHAEYAQGVKRFLSERGIRSELDLRNEKMGLKVREGILAKVPYLFIVGDKEVSSRKVSVRKRLEGDIGSRDLEEIVQTLVKELEEKA